jgi:hypothetical protein
MQFVDARNRLEMLNRSDIASAGALAAPVVFDNLEFDGLPFLQGVELALADGGDVKKHVSLSGIGGYEPKPAILHEFLDRPLWHVQNPLLKKPRCGSVWPVFECSNSTESTSDRV